MIFNISYTEAKTQPAASTATIEISSSSKTSVTKTIVAVLAVIVMEDALYSPVSFFSREYGV